MGSLYTERHYSPKADTGDKAQRLASKLEKAPERDIHRRIIH